MKRCTAQLALVILFAWHAETAAVFGSQTGSSNLSRVALADLSFITGLWRADWQGGLGEEHWSASSGDSMVGTFRFVKEGKARFYEFMLIEQAPEGPVLKLKHFNPGLIGWEEKAQVYSYPLIQYRPNTAVFERGDKKSRLTFHRTSRKRRSLCYWSRRSMINITRRSLSLGSHRESRVRGVFVHPNSLTQNKSGEDVSNLIVFQVRVMMRT